MVVVYDNDLQRKQGETNSEYIQRVCATKDINKMPWRAVAGFLNIQLGMSRSESWYRKNYHSGKFVNDAVVESTQSSITTKAQECDGDCRECDKLNECLMVTKADLDEQEARIDEKIDEFSRLKVSLADERSCNMRMLRRFSREESIKEIAHDFAVLMTQNVRMPMVVKPFQYKTDTKREGILLLSDWHYGMECDNPWNKFNPDICRKRVEKLLNRTCELVKQHSLSHIHVMNLSDLIAGRIHSQIRFESRFDVITQTMEVAEILADFLNKLSAFCSVNYYDCLDNHSRLEPNKKESMDLESLVRIIPWYLKERLINNSCIKICENEFGADIITCSVLGHNIIGVHGDKDRPTNALDRLSLMTHRHYDMLCTAHLHHFSADEQHQSVVVSNSSLMGVDRFAQKLRLTSDPSQTLVIATPENVCECIYRIVLK